MTSETPVRSTEIMDDGGVRRGEPRGAWGDGEGPAGGRPGPARRLRGARRAARASWAAVLVLGGVVGGALGGASGVTAQDPTASGRAAPGASARPEGSDAAAASAGTTPGEAARAAGAAPVDGATPAGGAASAGGTPAADGTAPADGAAGRADRDGAARPRDRVTFGEDVFVARGEVVGDVVTMGGDARIEGEVLGDVVTMGGDAYVDGPVHGEIVTMGGDLRLGDRARVDGAVTTMGGAGASLGDLPDAGSVAGWVGLGGAVGAIGALASWVGTALSGLASFTLLFLFGLLLQGLARDRMSALHVVIVRDPVRAGATGALAGLAAVAATAVLAITIVGIPVAVLVALALCAAVYVGLAAVAAVIGALLPTDKLRDKPVLQLFAGVAVLYVASLVPGVGTVALCAAGLVGLGAVVLTRLRETPPATPVTEAGPYRTAGTAG